MRKEPLFFPIFKLLLLLAILILLCFVWASSERVERELIDRKQQLQTRSISSVRQETAASSKRLWDETLPNLLEEDPYYAKILPEQLGAGFAPSGIRRAATIGKPDNLHPFAGWSEVMTWNRMCVGSAARMKFGIYETFAPNLAIKIEERGDPPEYWVHLREGLFWQPLSKRWFPFGFELAETFLKRHPVTAHDFKFYFDAIMNPHVSELGAVAARTLFGDIEDIKVIDDLTFVVRWKKPRYVSKLRTGSLMPLPCFVYQYFPDGKKILEDDSDSDIYRKNSIFALNFSQHWAKNIIVSCGPWLFDGMSDRMIRFRRDPDYFSPYDVLVEGMEVEIRSSFEPIWQDFKEGKFDIYLIRPEQLLELGRFLKSPLYASQKDKIDRLDYLGNSFSYVGWNMARELFRSKKVRQALTMGIDRDRIIRQTLNGMGVPIHGIFLKGSPSNDPNLSPWPYDPQKAKRMLEEEGWYDSDGDGVLDKMIDNKRVPFEFTLTYYVKNTTSKAVSEYIATALSALNIRVHLNGIDLADLSKVVEDKDFDALFLAWALGTPPEDPRQLWYSGEAKKKGSSNLVGFENNEVDKIIDELDFEKDPQKRVALYRRFDAILHEEQPYTFLFSPKEVLLSRSRLQNLFIPATRQDLIPGANVEEPDLGVTWIKKE